MLGLGLQRLCYSFIWRQTDICSVSFSKAEMHQAAKA